jgi:peptidoglycan/LPS O-acetylase OafA/YrhL
MAATRGDHTRPLATVPALDGLRGVAVLLVVLFHSGHLVGGFLGVDLFFVLSGFLITTLLLDEHVRTGSIRLGAFWSRRVRRLVPALVLVVVLTLLAVAVLFDLDSVGANLGEAVASLLYVSNWWSIANPSPYLTVLQHTWSLSIEAQFYVVWPVVLLVALRGRSRQAAVAMAVRLTVIGALVASIGMTRFHGAESLTRVYFGTDTRSVPLLFGAALAALLFDSRSKPSGSSTRALDVGACVTLVVFVAITTVVERTEPRLYGGLYAAVICPLLTVLVAAAARTPGVFSRAMSLPPIRALGLISYGVYLWHWPVMFLLNAERLRLHDWPLLGAQSVITVAIATASYLLVEQPVRQRRLPFTRATSRLAR